MDDDMFPRFKDQFNVYSLNTSDFNNSKGASL